LLFNAIYIVLYSTDYQMLFRPLKGSIEPTPSRSFTQNVLNFSELYNYSHPNVSLHPPLYTNKGKQELG
jgi:hypothetical protein